jgi:microcystin degradation protein MlrC
MFAQHDRLALMAAEHKFQKIAIGSIMHESNSFNAEPTILSDFHLREAEDARATLNDWAVGNSEVAGFVEEGRRRGFDLIPTIYAGATPKGPVASDAFEELTTRLVQHMREIEDLDGVLLALHGAMYTEEFPQADEEIVRRVRAALGPSIPLVVTHDFHANISPALVDLTDVLITYQQNPHIDTKQRGVLAASILSRMLAGEVRPRQAMVKPPVLWNIIHQNTSAEPLLSVTRASIELEQKPGILAASVACGYQYNDVPYIGPSVIVVTDGDEALAQREAQRLSDMMWEKRSEIRLELPDAASAVAAAMQSERFPVVLFDVGDNVGGGAAADETALLAELLLQQAKSWVVVVSDPAAVDAAKSGGIGSTFDQAVGGHSRGSVTKPVSVKGVVRSLHGGTFMEPGVRHGGHRYWDMGHCAVIEQEGSTRDDLNLLLLTSKPTSPFSLHQLIACGIYPERQKILIVKGTVAPRAAYEPIAASIQLVDTPGATSVNPERFIFHRARPGVWGLDA